MVYDAPAALAVAGSARVSRHHYREHRVVLLGTSGLVAAYVVVALLLLALNLNARWSWQVKALAIAVVSALYIVTYYSLPPLLGWPTDQALPKRFNLIAVHVQEPDKASGSAGQIVLWVTDMAEGPRGGEPRAHRVEFTQSLHEKVEEAGNKIRKGLPQLGELREEKVAAHATPATATQGVQKQVGAPGRPSDTTSGGQNSVAIEFYDLPDPLFPEK